LGHDSHATHPHKIGFEWKTDSLRKLWSIDNKTWLSVIWHFEVVQRWAESPGESRAGIESTIGDRNSSFRRFGVEQHGSVRDYGFGSVVDSKR
jgi:hypothetical protein